MKPKKKGNALQINFLLRSDGPMRIGNPLGTNAFWLPSEPTACFIR